MSAATQAVVVRSTHRELVRRVLREAKLDRLFAAARERERIAAAERHRESLWHKDGDEFPLLRDDELPETFDEMYENYPEWELYVSL